ncbi:GDP-mannose mannosyl hydrolase [Vibrio fluvialis]|nr:GDP-mannose mannosyl hydrolase [Vibrio fluvialis]
MTQRLDEPTFKTVVASTPLVSIDLIIRNSKGQILLGQRTNRPAQGFWFVPGGRICKDETFEQAFQRLTKVELGEGHSLKQAQFLGTYQHFYTDNFSQDNFSTHYVVLGYQLESDIELASLPDEQHNYYQWWDVEHLLSSAQVHVNTKAYFSEAYK